MPKPNQKSIRDLVRGKCQADPDAFKQAQQAQIRSVETYKKTEGILLKQPSADDSINDADPNAFKQAQEAQIDLAKTYKETGKIPPNWSLVDDFITETTRQQSWDALNEQSHQ